MKNKLLKIFFMSIMLFVLFASGVKADDASCETYTNYYFFSYIADESDVVSGIQNSSDGYVTKKYGTYVSSFPSTETIKSQGRVCMKKGDNVDGTSDDCIETMSLEDFYNYYKKTINDGTYGTLVTSEGETGYSKYTEGNNSYFIHGLWFEVDEDGNISDITKESQRIWIIETNKLVNASMFPSTTNINYTLKSEYVYFEVSRVLEQSGLTGIETFELDDFEEAVLFPTMYKVDYEVCDEVEDVLYKAKINYYYKDTGEYVEFEDGSDNPYTEDNLRTGYENNVVSPDLKNCTPDLASVDIIIEDKDFVANVYYTCKVDEEVTENVKTGSILFYIALIIGVGALGYAIYYYFSNKKSNA